MESSLAWEQPYIVYVEMQGRWTEGLDGGFPEENRREDMNLRTVQALALLLLMPSDGHSQEAVRPNPPTSGISIAWGMGRYAVRDEFISTERYSGTLPYIELS